LKTAKVTLVILFLFAFLSGCASRHTSHQAPERTRQYLENAQKEILLINNHAITALEEFFWSLDNDNNYLFAIQKFDKSFEFFMPYIDKYFIIGDKDMLQSIYDIRDMGRQNGVEAAYMISQKKIFVACEMLGTKKKTEAALALNQAQQILKWVLTKNLSKTSKNKAETLLLRVRQMRLAYVN